MAKVKYTIKENSKFGSHSFYAVPVTNGTPHPQGRQVEGLLPRSPWPDAGIPVARTHCSKARLVHNSNIRQCSMVQHHAAFCL